MNSSKIPYVIAITSVIFAGSFLAFNFNQDSIDSTGESTNIVGYVTLVLADENGIPKQYIQTKNAVHDDGFNQIIEDVYGANACVETYCDTGSAVFNIIGIGSGDVDSLGTSSNDLQTGLDANNGGICDRIADQDGASSTTDSKIVTISASFGGSGASSADRTSSGCETAITEVGLFNSATDGGGVMIAGQTFSSVTIGANDILTITWQITFS